MRRCGACSQVAFRRPRHVGFEDHLGANLVRLVMVVGGIFLIMACLKLAYLRARSPIGDARRDQSPWAIVSFALFAATPISGSLGAFGHPLSWRFIFYAGALATGLITVFSNVSIVLWAAPPPERRPTQRIVIERDDQAGQEPPDHG